MLSSLNGSHQPAFLITTTDKQSTNTVRKALAVNKHNVLQTSEPRTKGVLCAVVMIFRGPDV